MPVSETLGEPPVVAPMLAGGVGLPPDPTGWSFEPKWDGVRGIVRAWPGGFTITSRLGNDVTAGYPELAALASGIAPRAAVLDGEIVAFDDNGRPSFERIQRRMHVRDPSARLMAEVPVLYVVFDVLWLDGRLLTGEPLTVRRAALATLDLAGPSWRPSTVIPGVPDDALLTACRKLGLEGYVGKLDSSLYLPGKRSKSWTKVKCVRRREFVVGGWTDGSGGRTGEIGSLAVGWVDPEMPPAEGHPFALRYAGQVGSGIGGDLMRKLRAEFATTATGTSPFVGSPQPSVRIHPVALQLVVEVMFNEMTSAGVLRQPSVKGLRNDIAPADVVWTDELA